MKKGFTMIELIISLFLIFVLMNSIMNMFFINMKSFNTFISKDRNEVYAKEALRFIETEIKDKTNEKIQVQNGEISITKNDKKINIIKKTKFDNKYKIQIVYYKSVNSKENTVDICDGIKDFQALRYKNTIFMTIETVNGDKVKKCIGIEEKKDL